jgi:hypothetical protein
VDRLGLGRSAREQRTRQRERTHHSHETHGH